MTQASADDSGTGSRTPDDPTARRDAQWHRILTGQDPHLPHLRRWWRRVPSSPRCKLCAAPFEGVGALLTRVIMHGRSTSNPLLCSFCFRGLRDEPGGTELEISILFADIRGSTGIAERTSAAGFSQLVQRFYRAAAKAIDDHGGVVDKFLGDGVMALFIPVISGEAHAGRAIDAGRAVLSAAARELADGGARVGVGIHTGVAFVGTVGSDDRLDFTALGDTVNVAARLGSAAGPGEVVISKMAWDAGRASAGASNGADAAAERRTIEVQGRSAPLEIVVLRGDSN